MVRQWIAGAALFALISGYSWAEVAQPSDNILKEQFSKQYHGILKLDSITLKNLDSTGNQATWFAEGDISSREDMYTGVGMAADYYFVEKTWTKDRPVKFSAMLTSKGTPASGWTVNYYSLQMAASDQGRAIDDIKTNDKYLIVNSDDFNYRFGNIEASWRAQKASIPGLEEQLSALDKKIAVAKKEADAYWGKGADGKPLTRAEAFKKTLKERDDYVKANDSSVYAEKYEKEVYQPALDACRKQSEPCNEAAIQQKRDLDIHEQRRQVFLKSEELRRKAQNDWITLEKGQYPLNIAVQKLQMQQSDIRIKIMDINDGYERWKKDTDDLRRKGVIK
ncbi:DUF1202 domain-containing protein [Salmonella enterica]|uniref:DUF1202 domain-containing protein n=7 Tax=Salmonella enterica TaxID=28901 RepID=A0A3Y9SI43_SALET|nr:MULTISPECIES: DUF1202 domain-containing protein [Salmonella]EAA9665930.1 DUF1202 domain-containing protein [Salmonella enterica subsp. enterica serovar Infantis]EBA0168777.1 DUF1202 domain-containing protein [Salmonella enterica subsp. enterica serovar Enteritidis]EBX2443292.1 DUF1202 domain-containing protein [Salmonella enterica subsp. enterica serovar Hissar]EBY9897161.1 DUF1202 domain-containing protein [Salmonella enterica subsp. enterica serovar Typhisuis]ECK9417487.1 DUF1202 domain-c